MLADLLVRFPELGRSFDLADKLFAENDRYPLPSQVIYPPPNGTPAERKAVDAALWSIDYAVISVFVADLALCALLERLGIRPAAMTGHSAGQDFSFWAAGILKQQDRESILRKWMQLNLVGQSIGRRIEPARLMTVGAAPREAIDALLAEHEGALFLAMDNCPSQVILCGRPDTIDAARERLSAAGGICGFLPFDRGYHSPLFEPLIEPIADYIRSNEAAPPEVPLYSCASARPFPDDPEEIRQLMAEQWVKPVRFRETIESMHADGVRIFLEVGPRGTLSSFVDDTLGDREHLAVPLNAHTGSGIRQLHLALAQCAAHGVAMDLGALYAHRSPAAPALLPEIEPHEAAGRRKPRKGVSLRLATTPPRLTVSDAFRGFLSGGAPRAAEPGAAGPAAPERGARERAMAAYFRTMEQFLENQRTVIAACCGGVRRAEWTAALDGVVCGGAWSASICVAPERANLAALAGEALSEAERTEWDAMSADDRRKAEWLLGRVAAKDAVCRLLARRGAGEFAAREVVVRAEADGRPTALMAGGAEFPAGRLCLSIAHTAATAAALAGIVEEGEPLGVGIDIESAQRAVTHLEAEAFAASEAVLLAAAPAGGRGPWLLRGWCAKEAAAKAAGTGLLGDPRQVRIESLDWQTGRMCVTLGGEIAARRPGLAKRTLAVRTGLDAGLVFAVAPVGVAT
jgi:malonyl CoA-acyl carrier protein transacylase/phosphopantetheinyl transferase (holo-ACP synthase)